MLRSFQNILLGLNTHDLIVLNPICFSPSAHHERIVHSNNNNKIHALALKLIQMLDIPWKMADRAAGCKGPWYGEENYLLIRELLAGIVRLRHAAGSDFRFLVCVWNVPSITQGQSVVAHGQDIKRVKAYRNSTPSGKLSPTLRAVILASLHLKIFAVPPLQSVQRVWRRL